MAFSVVRVPESGPCSELLLAAVRTLCWEYRDVLIAHGVPIDSFQGYADEIRALPSKYVAARGGAIWLAVAPAAVEPGAAVGGAAEGLAADALSIELPDGLSLPCEGATAGDAPLASVSGRLVVGGCVALRDLGGGTGEIKRLYVHPACRRRGIAEALSRAVEAHAAQLHAGDAAGAAVSEAGLPCAEGGVAAGEAGVGAAASSGAAAAAPSSPWRYHRLVLDTLHRLEGALPLYTRLGFRPCAAYIHNPMPDVVFLEKALAHPA